MLLWVVNIVTVIHVAQSVLVSNLGQNDRAIDVRSSAEAREFFLYPLCPDRLWGPPSLLYNERRESFPGAKMRPGRDTDNSPLSSAKVENE
jgi:hypothetical protein